MEVSSVLILVLLGAWALTSLVLGIWIWAYGRKIAEFSFTACALRNEVARLGRLGVLDIERARLEDLTDDQLRVELDSDSDSS